MAGPEDILADIEKELAGTPPSKPPAAGTPGAAATNRPAGTEVSPGRIISPNGLTSYSYTAAKGWEASPYSPNADDKKAAGIPKPGSTYTPSAPKPLVNFAEKGAAEKTAVQLAGGGLQALPPSATQVGASGSRAIYNGVIYTKDPTTSIWTTTGFTPSKADVQAAIATKQQANTQQQNGNLRSAIGASALPEAVRPATASAATAGLAGMAGTLGKAQGITVPGMEQFNVRGAGVPEAGRHTIYGSDNELNNLHAGLNNGPPIQYAPTARRVDQLGNNIAFGNEKGGGRDYNIQPQDRFGSVAVSVPDSYVKGAGNTGDYNRAIDVPFNIGAGGASSFQLAGSNVQVNSPVVNGGSTGTGFALNAVPGSNIALATGRGLSADPAIQAAQTLMLIAAEQQAGGGPGAITALTAPHAGQYSGNPVGSVTAGAPLAGGQNMGQGNVFAGTPGPQDTVYNPDDRDNDSVYSAAKGATISIKPTDITLGRELPMGRGMRGMRRFDTGGTVTTPVPEGNMPVANPRAPVAAPHSTPFEYTPGPEPTAVVGVPPPGPQRDPRGPAWGMDSPPAAAPVTTSPTNPVYDPNDPTILDPYRARLKQEADQQRQRDATSYQWRIAGRPAPTALDVDLGYDTTASQDLPSGVYYSKTKALNDRINGINNLREDYAGLGPLRPEADVIGDIARAEQEKAPFENAQRIGTELAGLGQTGDPAALMQDINTYRQAMGPIAAIGDAQQKVASLGAYQDGTGYVNAIAGLEAQYKGYEAALNDPNAPAESKINAQNQMGAINQELYGYKNTLGQITAHNNALQSAQSDITNLMQQTGLTQEQLSPALAAYATGLDSRKNAYDNAVKAENWRNQITSLTGGRDPTAALGEIGTRLTGYNTLLGNVHKGADIGNRLQSLRAPAGFKDGGWIKTATSNAHGQFAAKAKGAGMSTRAYASQHAGDSGKTGKQARLAKTLMGFKGGGDIITMPKSKAKKSMITPEEIIGVGKNTGKKYFRVGEPIKPGGPPMEERLDFPMPNKMKITPLHRPALPLGKRRKVAA